MTIETKLFELRDSATFIPIVAMQMHSTDAREHWLLRRAGYSIGEPHLVLLTRLDGGIAHYDVYDWGGRTFPAAHQYIADNWHTLQTGALIDVRVILGEAADPCESEQT